MSPLEIPTGAEDGLTVDLDGYEGPLDMLLAMARTQRVDLRRISVLALAEQYLAFVEGARARRIELAADYLVMAAWLAYLKSRLLLPPEETAEEPSAEELAARLAGRLERLEAIRAAAERLMARPALGRDVFARGAPERVAAARRTVWRAGLADLLKAYGRLRTRREAAPLELARPVAYAVEAAIERLRRLVGAWPGWGALAAHLPPDWLTSPERRRSALASSFVASLELARAGDVEIAQSAPFAPLLLRPRRGA